MHSHVLTEEIALIATIMYNCTFSLVWNPREVSVTTHQIPSFYRKNYLSKL